MRGKVDFSLSFIIIPISFRNVNLPDGKKLRWILGIYWQDVEKYCFFINFICAEKAGQPKRSL